MPSGPNDDRAAVVVREWLLDVHQDALALRIGRIRIERRRERRDDGVAVEVGVVDEEPRIVREVRVQGESEQALLAARRDPLGDVEERLLDERRRRATTRICPACWTTKIRSGPVVGRDHIDRAADPVGDDIEPQDPAGRGRLRRRRRGRVARRDAWRRGPPRGGDRRRSSVARTRPARRPAPRPGRTPPARRRRAARAAWDRSSPWPDATKHRGGGAATAIPPSAPCYPARPGGPLLDRLISGAGALTDLADRAVRPLGRRGGGTRWPTRPGSVIVAVLLVALAALLVLAGLEVAGDPDPRALSAAGVDVRPGPRGPDLRDGRRGVSRRLRRDLLRPERQRGEGRGRGHRRVVLLPRRPGHLSRPHRPLDATARRSSAASRSSSVPATVTGMLRRDERCRQRGEGVLGPRLQRRSSSTSATATSSRTGEARPTRCSPSGCRRRGPARRRDPRRSRRRLPVFRRSDGRSRSRRRAWPRASGSRSRSRACCARRRAWCMCGRRRPTWSATRPRPRRSTRGASASSRGRRSSSSDAVRPEGVALGRGELHAPDVRRRHALPRPATGAPRRRRHRTAGALVRRRG